MIQLQLDKKRNEDVEPTVSLEHKPRTRKPPNKTPKTKLTSASLDFWLNLWDSISN